MKLTWRRDGSGVYEVRFRLGNFITHGYGPNHKHARDQKLKELRKTGAA